MSALKLAILKERRPFEERVAGTPETVKKLVDSGIDVTVEKGAGLIANISDEAYEKAGARIAKNADEAAKDAEVLFKVQRPYKKNGVDEFALLSKNTILIGMLDPYRDGELNKLADAQISAFSLELLPRITRAQSMDVLSSQSNLMGYKAVIDGAYEMRRAFPMMMTAAGRINPAKVLVMGAGVAGLQAIATARRLGAVVYASDVRPAAKEQVQSLGAKFVAVEDDEFKAAETAGGYAKEMSKDYQKKQAALLAETVADMDLVITTALIPGKPAPKLIDESMVKGMKRGAVIVDLAIDWGGNCTLSQANRVVTAHGVDIIANNNVPSLLSADASKLYANNILNFFMLLYDKESKKLAIPFDDELVQATLLTRDGAIVHKQFQTREKASQAKTRGT